MPFTQREAEELIAVQSVPNTRGQVKLWKKGEEIMIEIYGPFGPLVGAITVLGRDLLKAANDLTD